MDACGRATGFAAHADRARPQDYVYGVAFGVLLLFVLGAVEPEVSGDPFPVLSIITWAPFVGALLIMFTARHRPLAVRLIALVSTGVSAVLSVWIYVAYDGRPPASSSTRRSRWCRRSASPTSWASTASAC